MSRRGVPELVCLLFVLLLRLPFLNQPIQGDDVYYLAGAQYAQTDPLHPHNARYAFQGQVVDMRGHPHPPLNTWTLAGLLALTGDISERTYHAAYIAFSWIAALAMLSLARRFSPQPLLATLLFLATPAFVVNGTSLEADVPFLALWMAAIALFVRAEDGRSSGALAASAAAMALAALAAFQSVALVPVLGAYLLIRRSRWWPAWIALGVPLAILLGWQLWEWRSGGALPASVLLGYFQTYGLQRWVAKLRNAAALTVHAAWLVFPVLAAVAFYRVPKRAAAAILVATAALAFADPSPLFWASWGLGALVLFACAHTAVKTNDRDERFLASWIVLFFLLALGMFFAGSARYLLPVAAPVALLAARRLEKRPSFLAGCAAASLALGLALAIVNYQHWSGYRGFVESVRGNMWRQRTWVNGEWGLRYYAETDGAIPLQRNTALRVGDLVLTSDLGAFSPPGNIPRTLLSEEAISSWLPFRLIGLDSRSGYSTAAAGLRPFDLSVTPIDRVRAEVIAARRPTLVYLPMEAPEAENHIVGGLYGLESGTWRWTARRAVVALKAPDHPLALEATFYIPENAPARHIQLLADGEVVAEETFSEPGEYTLRSSGPLPAAPGVVNVVLALDQTFRPPGDDRDLGVVLKGIGFR
ncbi:MAG: glycosyltransferase family 39 protein [Bryobacteraceae bacterium]